MIPSWEPPGPEDEATSYYWGGYSVSSNLYLPRLRSGGEGEPVRFVWRLSAVASPPPAGESFRVPTADGAAIDLWVSRVPDALLYQVGDVGLFAIRYREALIEFSAAPRADPKLVEHTLVNAVLPIYASLTGTVCLHASAVARDGKALVFAGPSGVGKSTKALEMVRNGWKLVCDDAAVLRRQGEDWLVYPSALTLRLEGLEGAGWDNRGKAESFMTAEETPTHLETIWLLAAQRNSEPGLAERHGLLCSIQAGWRLLESLERLELDTLLWQSGLEQLVGIKPPSDSGCGWNNGVAS